MEYIKEPEKVKLHVVNSSSPSFTTWFCIRSAVIVIMGSMLLMQQSSSDKHWVSDDQIKINRMFKRHWIEGKSKN